MRPAPEAGWAALGLAIGPTGIAETRVDFPGVTAQRAGHSAATKQWLAILKTRSRER